MTTAATSAAPDPLASPLKQPVRLACVQLASGPDKAANLARARERVLEAASGDRPARIVVLPECFNSPYGTSFFPDYAEPLLPSPPPRDAAPSWHALSDMARDAGVFLIGGSIPEAGPLVDDAAGEGEEGGGEKGEEKKKKLKRKYYNTSLTFGPDGALIATHRKAHLFDIDIPGKMTFRESDVLSPGNKVTVADLPGLGRVAVAICYDIRFPELAAAASRRAGAFCLVYPGAFNLTTGPLHWKLQAQARAMDNQIYVAMCSPARDLEGPYAAWGHSMVVDPMAKVEAEAGEGEEVVAWDLDPARIDEVRRNIPLSRQRRFDIYPDITRDGHISFSDPDLPPASGTSA